MEDIVLNIWREADGVDENVELAVGGLELLEDVVDVGIDGDVALEGAGAGQVGGKFLGVPLKALILVADSEGCPGFGELLGDAPGDAALVGEAEDDGYFAFEIDHVGCAPNRFRW